MYQELLQEHQITSGEVPRSTSDTPGLLLELQNDSKNVSS